MAQYNLVSDGFKVGRHPVHSDHLLMQFTGGDDAFYIMMPLSAGQTVAQEIDNASVQSAPKPIGPDELGLGSIFHMMGFRLQSLPDGVKRLVLTIGVDDGARILPIELSAQDVQTLVDDLSRP